MKLTYARLFVDNLDVARSFYRDVLGLTELWNWQDVALGFDVGATLIIEKPTAIIRRRSAASPACHSTWMTFEPHISN